LAHVLFMQESNVRSRYKDAIQYYEPAVQKYSENILDITAVVLANLCVAYIMTSQNDKVQYFILPCHIKALIFGFIRQKN
jgi:tetratricopeptide repeat protein 30